MRGVEEAEERGCLGGLLEYVRSCTFVADIVGLVSCIAPLDMSRLPNGTALHAGWYMKRGSGLYGKDRPAVEEGMSSLIAYVLERRGVYGLELHADSSHVVVTSSRWFGSTGEAAFVRRCNQCRRMELIRRERERGRCVCVCLYESSYFILS